MNSYEYSKLPRDSKRESEILKWLRSQNETEKFEFIWGVLRENVGLGLPLVQKAQLRPIYLEVILEYGFVYGDASSVKYWYEATVQGLGYKRVIHLLRKHMDDAPLILYKMLYWLRPEDDYSRRETQKLREEFLSKYPNFSSTKSTGIHATNA